MKNLLIVLLFLAILLLAFFLYRCHKKEKSESQTGIACNHVPIDPTRIIFWKKPNVSKTDFKNDLNYYFQSTDASQIEYCDNCDSNLVVVSGADVALFISGKTLPGSPPPPGLGPVGQDANAYFSVDFPMEFSDFIHDSLPPIDSVPPVDTVPPVQIQIARPNSNGRATRISKQFKAKINLNSPAPLTHDTVIVAVFDTGVDSTYFFNQLYKSNIASCLGPKANNGWNFPSDTSYWYDDYPEQHGTVVAKLIADQEYQSPDTYIKILPVKVHTSQGVSHLSDILCALQYAKNRGAQIINASFGFYAPYDTSINGSANSGALLFKLFLKNYFEHSNILMIAAAGNKNDYLESYVYVTANKVARRDLDSVSFYPASFAKDIPNVFAVTTVSEDSNRISPLQNFSSNVVDVGVNADAVFFKDTFVFAHPFLQGYVTGSSFATPIVTGKIAAHYQAIKSLLSTPIIDKEPILKKLQSEGLLHTSSSPYFTDKIKAKRIMNK